MFAYLSKKIAIPGDIKLRALAWNSQNGWIACGGANGLLKVLKLESQAKELAAASQNQPGKAPQSNLSMNQTLEGHQGDVTNVAWNGTYRKLTSSDSRGKITVWMLYKGVWYEEMINNRNKSIVADLRWTPDGQRICISYEDGMTIVGNVDGNRIWGKELSTEPVRSMQWSPDGKNLLFGTIGGEIGKFDHNGNYLGKVSFPSKVVTFQWYDGSEGFVEQGCASLAVALEGGRVLLMTHDSDERQLAVSTGLKITCIQWSHNGGVLAVAGLQPSGPEGKEASVVMFYTPQGVLSRSLKVPGGPVTAMAWEGGGLRIALAIDSFIYFANIRPKYMWGFFDRTLVYSFTNATRREHSVMFWDTRNDQKYHKFILRLLGVYYYGDRCVLTQRVEEDSSSASTHHQQQQPWALVVCNAIGSPIDSKYIEIEPKFVGMTSTHIVAASSSYFYAWNYQAEGADSSSRVLQRDQRVGRDVVRHIDDEAESGQGLAFKKEVSDPICAIAARKDIVVIARRGGSAHLFQLPAMKQLAKFSIGAYAQTISINCDCSRLALVDSQALLLLYELRPPDRDNIATPVGPGGRPLTGAEALAHIATPPTPAGRHPTPSEQQQQQQQPSSTAQPSTPKRDSSTPIRRGTGQVRYTGKALPFERRDVWDLIWAEDNPDLLAVMEKTRMYILRGLAPEENILSSGYLCKFKNLKVRAVMLDEVLRSSDKPEKESLFSFDTMSLRDSRAMVENPSISFEDCVDFIGKHPHPRLWRALAEASLKRLDLAHAEKGFVRCGDYQGILFVKHLAVIADPAKQKAEVHAYFKLFNEAESGYRDIDRKDLAIDLRMSLGDWFRVVQLLQGAGGAGSADDVLLTRAWNEIGDYYAERRKYSQAVQFYTQASNSRAIADCYTALEDYDSLRQLVASTHEGDPLLLVLGERFQLVGMADASVAAYLKGGDIKAAIDCCVHLNNWDSGIELAEKHNFPQIEGLLSQYASHLLSKKRIIQAVQLYRKAGLHTESAKLLFQLAKQSKIASRSKQLCMLAALEVELYRKKLQEQQSEKAAAVASSETGNSDLAMAKATLDGLMADAAKTSKDKILEIGWRGAEAYHFLMLAHNQLYKGNVEAAMRTSLRLTEYEDILAPTEVHSLIALSAYYNKHYRQCSRAFSRLETLDPPERRQKYQELAFDIFVLHPPTDPETRRTTKCRGCDAVVRDWQPSCPQCGMQYPACVASGRPIFDNKFITCRSCKHPIHESEVSKVKICPLCHAIL